MLRSNIIQTEQMVFEHLGIYILQLKKKGEKAHDFVRDPGNYMGGVGKSKEKGEDEIIIFYFQKNYKN